MDGSGNLRDPVLRCPLGRDPRRRERSRSSPPERAGARRRERDHCGERFWRCRPRSSPALNAWAYDRERGRDAHPDHSVQRQPAGVLGPVPRRRIGFIGIPRPWHRPLHVPYDAVERPSLRCGELEQRRSTARCPRCGPTAPVSRSSGSSSDLQSVTGVPGARPTSGSSSDHPTALGLRRSRTPRVSLVLTQARYWSRSPQSERP